MFVAFWVIVAFLYGSAVGSFLNVVIYRLPRGESLLSPPSHCPTCGTRLRVLDLIPLFSFLWRRGKCAYCKAPIAWRYFWVELLTASLFAFTVFLKGPTGEAVLLCFLLADLVAIFFIDLEHYIIPDPLNLAGFLLGVVRDLHHWMTQGSSWLPLRIPLGGVTLPIPWSFAGALLGMGFFYLLGRLGSWVFKKEALGLGDVKFAGALGANLLPGPAVVALFFAVMAGSLVGLMLLAFFRQPLVRGEVLLAWDSPPETPPQKDETLKDIPIQVSFYPESWGGLLRWTSSPALTSSGPLFRWRTRSGAVCTLVSGRAWSEESKEVPVATLFRKPVTADQPFPIIYLGGTIVDGKDRKTVPFYMETPVPVSRVRAEILGKDINCATFSLSAHQKGEVNLLSKGKDHLKVEISLESPVRGAVELGRVMVEVPQGEDKNLAWLTAKELIVYNPRGQILKDVELQTWPIGIRQVVPPPEAGLTFGLIYRQGAKGTDWQLVLEPWQRRVPFGPFLALGTAVALFWGDSLWRWYLKWAIPQ